MSSSTRLCSDCGKPLLPRRQKRCHDCAHKHRTGYQARYKKVWKSGDAPSSTMHSSQFGEAVDMVKALEILHRIAAPLRDGEALPKEGKDYALQYEPLKWTLARQEVDALIERRKQAAYRAIEGALARAEERRMMRMEKSA